MGGEIGGEAKRVVGGKYEEGFGDESEEVDSQVRAEGRSIVAIIVLCCYVVVVKRRVKLSRRSRTRCDERATRMRRGLSESHNVAIAYQ